MSSENRAARLLEDSYGVRTVQKLLGHREVRTNVIYTPVLNLGVAKPSQLDG